MARLIRLLTLIAVVLMPMSMGAPASGHATMDMTMSHRADRATHHQSKGAFAECTMACASALPAVDRVNEGFQPPLRELIISVPEHELHGFDPETATPPPKAS